MFNTQALAKGQVQTLMEDGNDRMVLNRHSVQAIACPLLNSSAPFCQKQIVFLHYHLEQVLNHFKFLKHMTSAQGQSKNMRPWTKTSKICN